MGATTSIVSPSFSEVAARASRGTKSPFTAVATGAAAHLARVGQDPARAQHLVTRHAPGGAEQRGTAAEKGARHAACGAIPEGQHQLGLGQRLVHRFRLFQQFRRNLNRHALAVADDLDVHGVSDPALGDESRQVTRTVDRLPVEELLGKSWVRPLER